MNPVVVFINFEPKYFYAMDSPTQETPDVAELKLNVPGSVITKRPQIKCFTLFAHRCIVFGRAVVIYLPCVYDEEELLNGAIWSVLSEMLRDGANSRRGGPTLDVQNKKRGHGPVFS